MTPRNINDACRLHDRAVAARAEGKYEQANALAFRALKILEREEGPHHPDVANVLNHLAATCTDRGDYTRAKRFGRRAVRIMEKLNGDGDLARLKVQSLNGLASVYRMQGRYAEAEPLFKRALTLAEKTF